MDNHAQSACESCGRALPAGASNCPSCGAAVPAPHSDAPQDRYLGRLILDRYRIIERIARGGMGEVYKAEHIERDLEQYVAVKFLHRRFANEPSFSARFFNEARYSARIRHPNAVRVFDRGSLEDGTLFIVMEYVRGESLSRYIKRVGMIDIAPAIRIATQIASVLAEAHQSGVIHRDVKPDNIMLMKSARPGFPHVTVLDFGIAKMFDDDRGHQTDTNVIFGTPEYMSPEQGRGHPYDHRVDIYALGLLIYYMLVGKPPFTGKDKVAVVHQQCYEPVPLLHTQTSQPVPARLSSLVARMVAKDPAERPADMLEVMRELESLAIRDDGNAFEEALRQSAQRDEDTSPSKPSSRSARGRTVGSIAEPAREAVEEVRRQIARERGEAALASATQVGSSQAASSHEARQGAGAAPLRELSVDATVSGATARNRAGLAARGDRSAPAPEFRVRPERAPQEQITGVIPAERDLWQLSMRSASAALPTHQVRVGVSSGIRVGRREQLALVALALVLSIGILFALGRAFLAGNADAGPPAEPEASMAAAAPLDESSEDSLAGDAPDEATPAPPDDDAEDPGNRERAEQSAPVDEPRGARPQGLAPRQTEPAAAPPPEQPQRTPEPSADEIASAAPAQQDAAAREEVAAQVGRAALALSSGQIDEARRMVRELSSSEPAPDGPEWASLQASLRRADQLVSSVRDALSSNNCSSAEAAAASLGREVSAHLETIERRRIRESCTSTAEPSGAGSSTSEREPREDREASSDGEAPMRLPTDREETQAPSRPAAPSDQPLALPPAEL